MYQTARKGSLFEIAIPETFQGITVDFLLRNEWKLPKKMIHEWRMNKEVKINGAEANWHLPLAVGDALQVPFFKSTEEEVPAFYYELEVLYEDDHLLIVNKPAHMKTHPNSANEKDTLLNAVTFYLQSAGESCQVRHVHRLDVGTSGAILFAKHDAAYAVLSRLLEERHIKRTYLAIVHGLLPNKKGTINQPIGNDRHHPSRKRVSPSGKPAITHYQVLKMNAKQRLSFVQCQLDTGRTHQIRVHLSSIGYPLAGDRLYGGKPIVSRQALHSASIKIPHPFSGEELICHADVPDDTFHMFL